MQLQSKKAMKKIDKHELVAFVGLMLLAGVEKTWDIFVNELINDQIQNPMATMSINRYGDICRVFCFDDKRTRTK